jgi:hypothetical protein
MYIYDDFDMTGSIPENFFSLPNVTDFHYGNNRLTGDHLHFLLLMVMMVYNTPWAGFIPDSIALATSLHVFDASLNYLDGMRAQICSQVLS